MINRLRSYIFMRRHMRACERLQKMVEANAKAPATIEFKRRREAALSNTRKGIA